MFLTRSTSLPPCVIHEDEHLLVVNKPAGWNTHAPSPFAGEGIYEWLKHREPRWANLAIIHRLDKETSGVMVFGKTPLANRSLTEQFAGRAVRKTYVLLTDRQPTQKEFVVKSKIIRSGERYVSGNIGEDAETRFSCSVAVGGRRLKPPSENESKPSSANCYELVAEPLTGRTHQIRVHAAERGLPILGDVLYKGSPSPRVCLHAQELRLEHPATGNAVTFSAPADFGADARLTLRAAVIEPQSTDAFRVIHGSSDGWPGWYVERLGDFLLSQSEPPLSNTQRTALDVMSRRVYHKTLTRHLRRSAAAESSPQSMLGEVAPERFIIRENGVKFELSFNEGYSVGLFLDQRDNRRRLSTRHISADFGLTTRDSGFKVLNTFAYTCGFSVCAALAGAHTISLDLSKKYLEWGKRNFVLNGLDPAQHDFIYGDTFDWLNRFAKKGRAFDVVLLDPPTFSQSKESGVFRAEKDYGKLIATALPVLQPGGVLFCSTNAAEWPPEKFLATVESSIQSAGRKVWRQHYVPQPPDFPISRAEPAYLKTVWLQVS
jgi:23S rRNA (cytosine1962-C5)-methyltransferase